MTELLTAAQMRAIEQAAIESGEVTGLELMERAGRGVVEAILEEWPALKHKRGLFGLFGPARRAVIMCGPGNNGGDGFVISRLLHALRWEVIVFFKGAARDLSPNARSNYDKWSTIGPIHELPSGKERLELLCDPHPDLWVDAFFGIGLNRVLPEDVTHFMKSIYYEQNWCRAPIVAVDMPSGVSSDTGKSVQVFHLTADLTVTFHQMKHGHILEDGPDRCGKVVVKSIGIPAEMTGK